MVGICDTRATRHAHGRLDARRLNAQTDTVTDVRRVLLVLMVTGLFTALAATSKWGIVACIPVLAVGAVVLFYFALHKPVRRGPDYDPSRDFVRVATVENEPLADVVVAELASDGIQAFIKTTAIATLGTSASTNPSAPCDLYVPARHATRARALITERKDTTALR